jgi:hypothetical protein
VVIEKVDRTAEFKIQIFGSVQTSKQHCFKVKMKNYRDSRQKKLNFKCGSLVQFKIG